MANSLRRMTNYKLQITNGSTGSPSRAESRDYKSLSEPEALKSQRQMSKRRGLPRTSALREHKLKFCWREVSFVRGYSIVELLVVVTVFSFLAIIATQAVVLTLRGSRKGESLISVRENLDYAFAVMERQLRSAKSISSCSPASIIYEDSEREITNFSCLGGSTGYIASESARLTTSDVVVDCTQTIFTCPPALPGAPPSVLINVTAFDADSQGIEGASVTTSSRILLRAY